MFIETKPLQEIVLSPSAGGSDTQQIIPTRSAVQILTGCTVYSSGDYRVLLRASENGKNIKIDKAVVSGNNEAINIVQSLSEALAIGNFMVLKCRAEEQGGSSAIDVYVRFSYSYLVDGEL